MKVKGNNMKTKEEKLKLIDETVEFYKTNPRCATERNGLPVCEYWLPDKPHGCAVGRLFKTEEERKAFQESMSEHLSTGANSVFYLLPDYIREWGKEFLCMLQNTHDEHLNNPSIIANFKQRVTDGYYDNE